MATANDKAVLNAIFNPLLPSAEAAKEEITEVVEEDEKSTDERVARAKELEFAGVKAAESGQLDEAIRLFTEAIATCPDRPSCYNNRAQALRLNHDVPGAKADLDKAIELSQGHGRGACQAYTQRALINRLQKDDCAAKSDFEAAARLGSDFAKTQLVAMNPYAAMCNKMLSDVMERLRRGEPEDQHTDSHPAA